MGFWPEYAWGILDNDDLSLISITNPRCYRDIVLTYNKNKADNKYVDEFFNFLLRFIERVKNDYILDLLNLNIYLVGGVSIPESSDGSEVVKYDSDEIVKYYTNTFVK